MEYLLAEALKKNALSIGEEKQQQLIRYLDLMQTWNRVFNLTSITEKTEMVYLHLIDSLMVRPYLQGQRCLDVGTGAGLPGIPLAIVDPDTHWTLLDKNSKKTGFLLQVIAELSLPNVTVVHTRTEDFHSQQGFDSIVSRAFGSLKMFAETTGHLLSSQGILIAMKGKYPQNELTELPKAFQLLDTERLNIKGIDVERHVIRLKKG